MADVKGVLSSFCSTRKSGTASFLHGDVGQLFGIEHSCPSHMLIAVQAELLGSGGRPYEPHPYTPIRQLALQGDLLPPHMAFDANLDDTIDRADRDFGPLLGARWLPTTFTPSNCIRNRHITIDTYCVPFGIPEQQAVSRSPVLGQSPRHRQLVHPLTHNRGARAPPGATICTDGCLNASATCSAALRLKFILTLQKVSAPNLFHLKQCNDRNGDVLLFSMPR